MGLADLWVGTKASRNFPRLNTISTQFDLIVDPTNVFIVAIFV